MKVVSVILISLLLCLSFGSKGSSKKDQPSNAQYTVHIVPHTHDDIGWLKTVDEYFYDSHKNITIQGVQYILDDLFPLLSEDSTKRFIYVEIGFFKRWWDQQSVDVQAQVKDLVNKKQFEFINGGWCMNDEAAVYYEDSIEQMTLGHKFLLENFNVTPTVGWHIDPFGHAAAQASLFAQMGFNAFYFSRIDYEDKDLRTNNQALETLWIPNTSQGIENAILTHINYNGYGDPPGFCFDVICGDDPIMDDVRLSGYNIDKKSQDLVDYYTGMKSAYLSNTFMHTAGGDFNWMAPNQNYKNWDKLLNYINPKNATYNMSIVYSTPSQYLAAVYPQNITYPLKTDDFFPYADDGNSYWTGYFISRVSLKGLMREQGRLLQAVKRLSTQAAWHKSSDFVNKNFDQIDAAIVKLEEAVSTNQHHDAAPGTSKQAVAEDYKFYLSDAADKVRKNFLIPYFQERAQADLKLENLAYESCNLNGTSALCNATYLNKGKTIVVSVYNSGPSRYAVIKVKVSDSSIQVSTPDGLYLPTDIICANTTDPTDCLLVFSDYLVGYTLNHFYIVPVSGSNVIIAQGLTINSDPVTLKINSNQTLTINNLTNYTLNFCQDRTQKVCTNTSFTLGYNQYFSYVQDNDQNSGAYIFRPSNDTINGPVQYDSPTLANLYQGHNHLHLRLYGGKITTDIRVYRDIAMGIEVETFVDSININDGVGKEIVLSVQVPSINNDNTFYTDSMGMELQKRVVNYRPTWNLTVTQPVSGNYYPVQSTILINDTKTGESLAIIPDRAQGGGSINNSQVELMIHRRILNDDSRGVDEPLNETDADGKGMRQWVRHTLLFNVPGYGKITHRDVQHLQDTPVIALLAPTGSSAVPEPTEIAASLSDSFTGLDSHIKVMSRVISPTSFLLRFQNLDEIVSRNVTTSVFTSSELGKSTVSELTLSANQGKANMLQNRYNWNNLGLNNPNFAKTDYLNTDNFGLRPLEIRTFLVTFGASSENNDSDVETVTV